MGSGLRAPASPQVSNTLWVPRFTTLDKGYRRVLPGGGGQSPEAQAPTHRYVEVDISLVKGHSGGVQAPRLHSNGPGKQEKDDEAGGHQADEHCQEHGELPMGKQDPG